jgi:hypothetical protein
MNLKNYVLLSLCVMFAGNLMAKDSKNLVSGVYLTYNDFKCNKLAHEAVAGKERIKTYDAFGFSFIKVICGDQSYVYPKSNIYGYADNKGVTYRFFNQEKYKLESTGNLFIYSRNAEVKKGSLKNVTIAIETKYFFSLKGDSEIMPLTLYNVKKTFIADAKIQTMLDEKFKTDEDLAQYDPVRGEYRLCCLLSIEK